jgi:hypothetical protein
MSSHAATATIDHHHDPSTSTGIPNKKLLMWAFLASDCMFFGDADFDPPDLPPAPAAGGLDPEGRSSASNSPRSRPSSS